MHNGFDFICDTVEKLKKKYAERDPFKLCHALDIRLLFVPMGKTDESCKGFFLTQSRIKSITINSELSVPFRRITCAHEVGHAVLHSKSAGVNAFHDFGLFDAVSALEYEANIFAAELLLEDEDVLARLNDDLSFFQAAAALYVPSELLDFKFRTMKWKGYKIIDAPLMTAGDWLKDAPDGGKPEDFS